MCGICGKINFKINNHVDPIEIERMAKIICHRGPDDFGVYHNKNVALGACRLSIIDLKNGHQPMCNEDGTFWIIYNGIIYNFPQLRDSLKNKGHFFKTDSDTEIILHLYEEYGFECLNKLDGMFAFAVFDKKNNTIFLARDRFGIKPLYYTIINDSLLFASEIKSLLANNIIEKKIDLESLNYFFSCNYVPGNNTIIENIKNLPPGHFIYYKNGSVTIKKYWEITYNKPIKNNPNDILNQIDTRLNTSIKQNLISDVPIGLLLSGGIDSNTILYFTRKNTNKPIHTFCVGFEEPEYDERKIARLSSQIFNTIHHEYILKAENINFKEIIWSLDNIIADNAIFPMYFISKEAKQYVSVLLSGDGGDEIFFGYQTYIADLWANYFRILPGFIKNHFLPKIANLIPIGNTPVSLDYKLKLFTTGAKFSPLLSHYWWRQIFTEEEKKELFSDDIIQELKKHNTTETYRIFESYFNTVPISNNLEKCIYTDRKIFLPNLVLMLTDALTMANSIETRVPLLDHNLMELINNIPTNMKINYSQTKTILKRIMRDKLPKTIINNKKHGLSVPFKKWFKNELKDLVLDYMSPGMIKKNGFFKYNYINRILKEFFLGKVDHSRKILGLLIFLIWQETFIPRHD